MASSKQRRVARRNIKKAAKAARKKRTIAHLSKRTRTALGKELPKRQRREPAKLAQSGADSRLIRLCGAGVSDQGIALSGIEGRLVAWVLRFGSQNIA